MPWVSVLVGIDSVDCVIKETISLSVGTALNLESEVVDILVGVVAFGNLKNSLIDLWFEDESFEIFLSGFDDFCLFCPGPFWILPMVRFFWSDGLGGDLEGPSLERITIWSGILENRARIDCVGATWDR